tara:strand:- start:4066 stop:4371 length:306 start_codon:yes stop_codon:yes gene_type:complete
MSNERINEHIIEAQMKTIRDQTGNRDFPPGNRHLAYGLVVYELLTELKRCYDELDIHGIGISFDPKHNEEDEEILTQWLEATTNGYYGSVYEYKYDITASE